MLFLFVLSYESDFIIASYYFLITFAIKCAYLVSFRVVFTIIISLYVVESVQVANILC